MRRTVWITFKCNEHFEKNGIQNSVRKNVPITFECNPEHFMYYI